jgi:tetratricopeptide (TPR) repeat protein
MLHTFRFVVIVALLMAGTATAQSQVSSPEITSLLGVTHASQPDAKGEVKAAEEKWAKDPQNTDLLIALGRAQANIWRYQDAIATYTRGIKLAPTNALLYRHRGHRYISTRQFDKAVADLEQAAKLNAHDFDIWHYLKGDYSKAMKAYEQCRAVAEKEGKDDSIIAVSDWLYMTYRRAKKNAEAAKILDRITPNMKVKENQSYFDRLLFYKGLKQESEIFNLEKASDLEIATVGYGLGNWHWYNGNRAKAEEYFRKITSGKYWPAFGFIAAEVELARKR